MASAQQKIQQRGIIIVGKTGNGKSSTANSLSCSTLFPASRGLTAVSQTCLKETWKDTQSNITYDIVDTPGLFDTGMQLAQAALEIQRSLSTSMCPKPHAFLLVFSAANRFSDEEIMAVEFLQVIFGNGMFDHCIIVFTHGDEILNETDFRIFYSQSKVLAKLVERCSRRITYIENKRKDGNLSSRSKILELIEEMCVNGTKRFDFPLISTHRSVLDKHLKTYKEKKSYQEELIILVDKLKQKLENEVWKQRAMGAVGGAVAFGLGAWICYLMGPAKVVAAGTAAVATGVKR